MGMPGALRDQRKTLDPLKLELYIVEVTTLVLNIEAISSRGESVVLTPEPLFQPLIKIYKQAFLLLEVCHQIHS